MPRCKFTATIQFLALMASIVWTTQATAKVKLPPVLSSHMVLQRDMPLPIWGTATPGEKVTVKLPRPGEVGHGRCAGQVAGETRPAQGRRAGPAEDRRGRYPHPGGRTGGRGLGRLGPVEHGHGRRHLHQGRRGAGEDAAKTYTRLRLIGPGNPGWLEATPENIAGISAMLFSFGLPLHKELDVPVGLMVGAVGGTPSGYWLSQEAYEADAACKEVVEKFAKPYSLEQAKKSYEQALAKWEKDVAGGQAKGRETLAGQAGSAAEAGRVPRQGGQPLRDPASAPSCPLPSAACSGTRARAARRSAASISTH